MSGRIMALALACGIVLAACANGGDPTDDYLDPQSGADGAGGGSDSANAESSASGSGGGSSGSGSGGASSSGSSGADAGAGGDSGGSDEDAGGGGDSGDGGSPTSCTSPDTCSASATALTSIAGDESGPTDTETGTTSEWLRIDLTEQDNSPIGHPMKITAVLTSPSGSNFDLYAYLGSMVGDIQCTNAKGQSTNGAGQTDTVSFEWGETGSFANGVDDSATVMLEVRAASGTTCSSGNAWSLAVHGN